MKEGLENIDEAVKQAFEGFEVNVDPSVWTNIQNSIAPTGGGGSSINPNPGTTSIIGKSLALKIAGGVLAISSIAAGAYFILNDIEKKDSKINIVESKILLEDSELENKIIKLTEEVKALEITAEIEKQRIKENIVGKDVIEEKITEDVISIENSNLKEDVPIVVNSNNEEDENSPQEEGSKKEMNLEKSVKEDPKKVVEKKASIKNSSKEEDVLMGVIQASVTKGVAPLDVIFDVDGDNIVSYLWDFGDNTRTSNEESSFHTYNKPGTYKVELTIIDKNANPKTLIKVIEVESRTKSSLEFIQNTFTPNGDGNNDELRIKGENIKTFNARILSVVNGSLIYEWNSIEDGWDGKDKSGVIMESGAYLLIIQATGSDGEEIPRKQVINLIK